MTYYFFWMICFFTLIAMDMGLKYKVDKTKYIQVISDKMIMKNLIFWNLIHAAIPIWNVIYIAILVRLARNDDENDYWMQKYRYKYGYKTKTKSFL